MDYIMASACFPIFKSVQIGNNDFIDGGIGDNMPVRMLLKRGVEHIITVDIGGVGMVHNVNPEGATIIPIKHSLPLGALFDLSPKTLNFNQNLGYMDTMKVFGRYPGKYFFFTQEEYVRMTGHFSRYTCEGLEEAGLLYGIQRDRLYGAREFFDALMEAFENEYKMLSNEATVFVDEYYNSVNENYLSYKVSSKGIINSSLIINMGIVFAFGAAIAFVAFALLSSFADSRKLKRKHKLIRSIKNKQIKEAQ